MDGFVALEASPQGGELITKPITFAGENLFVNFRTKAGGELRVEIQDPSGQPLEGFSLADCQPLSGDEIEQPVAWNSNGGLKKLAGRPIRLRFVLKAGDLYAYQFRPGR